MDVVQTWISHQRFISQFLKTDSKIVVYVPIYQALLSRTSCILIYITAAFKIRQHTTRQGRQETLQGTLSTHVTSTTPPADKPHLPYQKATTPHVHFTYLVCVSHLHYISITHLATPTLPGSNVQGRITNPTGLVRVKGYRNSRYVLRRLIQ